MMICFFFFSSRRRHTRFSRDWSSDVCSSDLPTPTVTGLNPAGGPEAGGNNVTITGTGFTGATSVVFGSSGATNVVVMNDTTITVDAPEIGRASCRERV